MYKISEQQANTIRGKVYAKDCLFNPIQDINGDWFISDEEVALNTNWRYEEMIATLEKLDFVPPKIEDIFS